MRTIDKILKASKSFYNELRIDEHGRFRSWKYCYKIFHDARKADNPDIDLVSLHLSFYLTSWGMYRGSCFLFQKDYKIHMPVINEILKKKYDALFGIKCCDLLDGKNLELVFELRKFMFLYYKDIK